MPSDSLKLIVPATSLPAEGCEPGEITELADGGTAAESLLSRLTAMTRLVGDEALVLGGGGADGETAPMEAITFSAGDGGGACIALSEADADWGTEAFSRAIERFKLSESVVADGSNCERFAECLAIAFNEDGDDKRRVPLLAERDGEVYFYGVWEASDADLEALASTWSGDAASGWLPIGDDDEVEGRGLREIALGIMALGMVAASGPTRAMANTVEVPAPEIAIEQVGDEQAVPVKATVVDIEEMLDFTSYDAPNEVQDGARIDLGRLAGSTTENTRIIVDVAAQRAYILVDGLVVGETPVSTARSGKYTPRGVFHITQKKVDKVSTIYHVDLPYWMRLDQSAIGLHTGELPGRPASAGCIRLPDEVAKVLFSHIQSGTAVEVVDAWSDAPHWL